jgi:hypothetical protein
MDGILQSIHFFYVNQKTEMAATAEHKNKDQQY